MSQRGSLLGIGIDLDSVAAHLRGYGIAGDDEASVYRVAIPRILELLEAFGARATFFFVAGEAARFAEVVRGVAAAGHEVACHSMTHPQPLDLASPEVVRYEIADAKELLESLCARPVLGFRAPGWGASPELLRALAAAGYRYDASSYPSWMMYLLRWSVARRGQDEGGRARGGTPVRMEEALLGKARAHVVAQPGGALAEIPVATIPLLRIPVYHTFRFLLPPRLFRVMLRAVRLRAGPLTYAFHATDFLDLEADRIDGRLIRHPGMDRTLGDKLAAAHEALSRLGRGRQSVTLAKIALDLLGGTR